jgi:hypothetical protein
MLSGRLIFLVSSSTLSEDLKITVALASFRIGGSVHLPSIHSVLFVEHTWSNTLQLLESVSRLIHNPDGANEYPAGHDVVAKIQNLLTDYAQTLICRNLS